MNKRLILLVACAIAARLSAQTPAQVLAPTGTLRVVFLGMNPVQGRFDAQTGRSTGPVPEIVEALGAKIGVPVRSVSSPHAAGIASALDTREADIGVLAYDEERTRDVDYGAPLLVMFNSYLVKKDSAIRRSGDIDRAG